MLGHDFRAGIWDRRAFLLLPCFVALFPALLFAKMAILKEVGSLGGILLYLFTGCLSAEVMTVGETLTIPALWMIFHSGCLLYTVGYPIRDLEQSGIQILLRGGGRIRWWLSKCVWNVLSVALYMGTALVTLVIFCLLAGVPLSLSVNSEAAMILMPNCDVFPEIPYSTATMFLHLILVPLLMTIALNLLQTLLSLLSRPFLGFVACVAMLAWAIFQTSPVVFGNYGMLQRDRLFYSGGLNFTSAIPGLLGLSLGLVAAGCLIIKRKNILSTDKGG